MIEQGSSDRRLTVFLWCGVFFAVSAGAVRLFTNYDNSEYYSAWLTLRMSAWGLNPKDFTHPALHYYLNLVENYLVYAAAHHWLGVRDLWEYWATFYMAAHPPMIVIGRIQSLLLGLGTAALMYHTTKRFWGRREAVLAFLLFISTGSFSHFSGYFKYINTNLFFNMLAVHCILAFYQYGCGRRMTAAAAAVAFAFASDYPSLSLIVPLLFVIFEKSRGEGKSTAEHIKQFLPAALRATIIIIAIFIFFNPYILMDFATFREYFTFHLRLVSGEIEGASRATGPLGYFTYLLMMATPMFLGPFFFVIFWLGVTGAFKRRKDAAVVLLLYVIFYIIAISSLSRKESRFLFAAAPPICMLTSIYFFRISGSERLKAVRLKVIKILAIIFLALQFTSSISNCVVMQIERDVIGDLRKWVEGHVPDGAVVALEDYNPPLMLSERAVRERIAASDSDITSEGRIMQAVETLVARRKNAPRYYQIPMTDRPYLDAHTMHPEYFSCAGVGWVILNETTAEKHKNSSESYSEFLRWLRKQGPPAAIFKSSAFSDANAHYSVYRLKPTSSEDEDNCDEIINGVR
ncbi:MAG: hypothetical protein AB1546_05730 [bacterium]